MVKIAYIEKGFSSKSMVLINKANEILAAYAADGFMLTLRQLYYQFVARDLLPNNQKSYDNLGSTINQARLAGLIDWEGIEDRTRHLRTHSSWDSPADIVRAAAQSFRLNPWENQQVYFEVWIEKDALVGIIEPPCEKWRLPYYACRGYNSQSEHWRAAMRIKSYNRKGYEVIILHMGDHDPSGIDMTRDLQDRFEVFGARAEVRRIALNMNQIEQYGPPPNPAKLTDSRAIDYIDKYGEDSWELDALEPRTIAELITDEVSSAIDLEAWEATMRLEESQRDELDEFANNYRNKGDE